MSDDIPILLAQRQINDSELKKMLDNAIANGEIDNFFAKFHYYSITDPSTLIFGESLLSKCQKLAPDVYEKLHKGTPFYWLARSAFLVHDYETAAFYIDAAVSEDLKNTTTTTDTPALLFFQIDDSNLNQASLDLVKLLRATIETAIVSYNRRLDAQELTFAEIQTSLLRAAITPGKTHLRTLATTFISFFLEWQHRSRLIQLRTEPGTAEPFFVHLFKGCVLFESLLKANPAKTPSAKMLVPVLNELRADLGFSSKGNIETSNYDFQQIVGDIATDDSSVFTAVVRAARIRNTTGHNLGWQVAIGVSEYNTLAGYVASSCLHAIACLYR